MNPVRAEQGKGYVFIFRGIWIGSTIGSSVGSS